MKSQLKSCDFKISYKEIVCCQPLDMKTVNGSSAVGVSTTKGGETAGWCSKEEVNILYWWCTSSTLASIKCRSKDLVNYHVLCETSKLGQCFLCGCRILKRLESPQKRRGDYWKKLNCRQWSNSWSLHDKGRWHYWRSSIASNEATVGVSTAKRGETTEGRSIASNEATVELFEIT